MSHRTIIESAESESRPRTHRIANAIAAIGLTGFVVGTLAVVGALVLLPSETAEQIIIAGLVVVTVGGIGGIIAGFIADRGSGRGGDDDDDMNSATRLANMTTTFNMINSTMH